uniref:Uncharacterized protein n=1 Tax=Oryza meridionalis TaxID=40149 RepID=A0A0E0DWM5_9ORYZ
MKGISTSAASWLQSSWASFSLDLGDVVGAVVRPEIHRMDGNREGSRRRRSGAEDGDAHGTRCLICAKMDGGGGGGRRRWWWWYSTLCCRFRPPGYRGTARGLPTSGHAVPAALPSQPSAGAFRSNRAKKGPDRHVSTAGFS